MRGISASTSGRWSPIVWMLIGALLCFAVLRGGAFLHTKVEPHGRKDGVAAPREPSPRAVQSPPQELSEGRDAGADRGLFERLQTVSIVPSLYGGGVTVDAAVAHELGLGDGEITQLNDALSRALQKLKALERDRARVNVDEWGEPIVEIPAFPNEGTVVRDELISSIQRVASAPLASVLEKNIVDSFRNSFGEFGQYRRQVLIEAPAPSERSWGWITERVYSLQGGTVPRESKTGINQQIRDRYDYLEEVAKRSHSGNGR